MGTRSHRSVGDRGRMMPSAQEFEAGLGNVVRHLREKEIEKKFLENRYWLNTCMEE